MTKKCLYTQKSKKMKIYSINMKNFENPWSKEVKN